MSNEKVMTEVGYIEARVNVPRSMADAVGNFVIDNISPGLVLEDEEDSLEIGIIFYVHQSDSVDIEKLLGEYLENIISDEMPVVPEIKCREVSDTDWIEKYKKSIKPHRVGDSIFIRPKWSPRDKEAAYDIIIEPKMAFGTGSHETTQSCLLAMHENFKRGMRLLDIGTGSGILSILADKLGASYIKAIDYDLVAIDNCKENFLVNEVKAENEILFGSIEKCNSDDPYGFVSANIIKSTILPMLPRLVKLTLPEGFLVLSGLLEEDISEITEALESLSQSVLATDRNNKWVTLLVRKS